MLSREIIRYYFWEEGPSYGLRQMGKIDGYNSIQELMKDMDGHIKSCQKEGWWCGITRAEIFMALSPIRKEET